MIVSVAQRCIARMTSDFVNKGPTLSVNSISRTCYVRYRMYLPARRGRDAVAQLLCYLILSIFNFVTKLYHKWRRSTQAGKVRYRVTLIMISLISIVMSLKFAYIIINYSLWDTHHNLLNQYIPVARAQLDCWKGRYA